MRRDHLNRPEPHVDRVRPGRYRQRGAAQSVAVPALGIDVQFGRHLCVLERHKIDHRIFAVHGIVFRLDDEGRRRVACWVDVGILREVLVGKRQITGIDDYGEIRTATKLVSRVNWVIDALVEVGADGRSKMAAC